MNVDEYLNHVGLEYQFWRDPSLRFLVELLLKVRDPASGSAEGFLAGIVHMDAPDGVGTQIGVVRDIAVELLEAAISGHVTTLMSTAHIRPMTSSCLADVAQLA